MLAELGFSRLPEANVTAEDTCFYTKWGLHYVRIVARVLFSSGGALPYLGLPSQ